MENQEEKEEPVMVEEKVEEPVEEEKELAMELVVEEEKRERITDPFSCQLDMKILEEHRLVRFEIMNIQIKLQDSAIFNIAIHTSNKTIRYHQVTMCNEYYKQWSSDEFSYLFIRYFIEDIFNGIDIVFDPTIDFYCTRLKI